MANTIYKVYYLFVAVLSLYSIFSKIKPSTQKYWFLVISVPLVCFAMYRPFGLMRDDPFYEAITSWQIENYISKIQSLRDPLYYVIALTLSKFSNDSKVILVFAGFVLMLKLIVIYRLGGDNKLLLLFMYLSIYWQLHDLTQLRVGLSAFLFLAYFYFYKANLRFYAVIFGIFSMLAHAQALLNIIIIYNKRLLSKQSAFLIVFFSLFMIGVGWVPELDAIVNFYNYLSKNLEYQLSESFRSYVIIYQSDWAPKNKRLPLILVVNLCIYSYVMLSLDKSVLAKPHVKKAYSSILLAAVLSWIFASTSDIQVRFYEYYFIAGLVIAAEVVKRQSLMLLYTLSVCYFVKFNVLFDIWNLGVIDKFIDMEISNFLKRF
jgi:hypothetical protein